NCPSIMIDVMSCRVASAARDGRILSRIWIPLPAVSSRVLLKQFLEHYLGRSKGNTFGAPIGTDSSRGNRFQNRPAPLYLTCIATCEAQKQRRLLLVLAE